MFHTGIFTLAVDCFSGVLILGVFARDEGVHADLSLERECQVTPASVVVCVVSRWEYQS